MPGFDGTGPLGEGPMTGLGQGYCILTGCEENPGQMKGFAGLQSMPVGQEFESLENVQRETIDIPARQREVSADAGPMTKRATGSKMGFPIPGYRNPGGAWMYGSAMAMGPGGPYGVAFYGYAACYVAPYSRIGSGSIFMADRPIAQNILGTHSRTHYRNATTYRPFSSLPYQSKKAAIA